MLTDVLGPETGPGGGGCDPGLVGGVPKFPLFAEDAPEELPPQPAKNSAAQIRKAVSTKSMRWKMLLYIGVTPMPFFVGITTSGPSCTPEHLPGTNEMGVAGRPFSSTSVEWLIAHS